jgi:AcrR family transcriptional regulator
VERASSRERIIKAAYAVLGGSGFDSASVKEIASEAKVAPGLIHYYFKSKDELLLAVLSKASEQYTREMAALLEAHGGKNAGTFVDKAFAVPRKRVDEQPQWYKLRYRLFALGINNPTLGEGVRLLLESGRSGISHLVNAVSRRSKTQASSLAAVLLACFDGLALQKLMDPDFDIEGAFHVVRGLVSVDQ